MLGIGFQPHNSSMKSKALPRSARVPVLVIAFCTVWFSVFGKGKPGVPFPSHDCEHAAARSSVAAGLFMAALLKGSPLTGSLTMLMFAPKSDLLTNEKESRSRTPLAAERAEIPDYRGSSLMALPVCAGIGENTATLGGGWLSAAPEAVKECGVLYALSQITQNPLLEDKGVLRVKVPGGTAAADFMTEVGNLQAGAEYSVRAYAVQEGGKTQYSEAVCFRTLPDSTPPYVVSIVRQDKPFQFIPNTSAVFRVTYSEAVELAEPFTSHFKVIPAEGSNIRGTVESVKGKGGSWDVKVRLEGAGDFRLAVVD